MRNAGSDIDEFRNTLINESNRYHVELSTAAVNGLVKYYRLVQKWNPLLNLVASCSPAEFATRHVLESLMAVEHLSLNARVADVGSGGGLPIIPCLVVRVDLEATLIESSARKAIFLREALLGVLGVSSVLGLEHERPIRVVAGRFENDPAPPVEFVTCRALDHFSRMFSRLVQWTPPGATLLLFGGDNLRMEIEAANLEYTKTSIPGAERRFLLRVPG